MLVEGSAAGSRVCPVCAWVSTEFSGFHSPPKKVPVGESATPN